MNAYCLVDAGVHFLRIHTSSPQQNMLPTIIYFLYKNCIDSATKTTIAPRLAPSQLVMIRDMIDSRSLLVAWKVAVADLWCGLELILRRPHCLLALLSFG